jgi:hypothetical protein
MENDNDVNSQDADDYTADDYDPADDPDSSLNQGLSDH